MNSVPPPLFARIASVAIAAAMGGSAAAAGVNLGFEDAADAAGSVPGWSIRGAGAVLTTDAATEGRRSLHAGLDSQAANLRLIQRIDAAALAGDRVRITASVRTDRLANGRVALLVRVDGDAALLYVDRSSRLTATTDAGWSQLTIEAPLSDQAEQLTFGADVSGNGELWIDDFRIDAYDTATLPAAQPAALRYVDRALAIMREHALRRNEIDWPRLIERAHAQARGATETTDAYLAVQFALGELGDQHSFMMSPERLRTLAAEPVSNARTGRRRVDPASAALGDRIGYISVPGFAGGSHRDQAAFADDLQRRLAMLDSPRRCGWIIDLRGNSGGNLWPMLAGIGPLVGADPVGYARHSDGTRRPIGYTDGRVSLSGHVQLRLRREPYMPALPLPPTAVLIDGRTASAGEIVALFLTARDTVRTFGTATRGVPTGTRRFPLSDGAALILTVAATLDRHGRVADGPIQPDHPLLQHERDRTDGLPAAALAAIDWLADAHDCR